MTYSHFPSPSESSRPLFRAPPLDSLLQRDLASRVLSDLAHLRPLTLPFPHPHAVSAAPRSDENAADRSDALSLLAQMRRTLALF